MSQPLPIAVGSDHAGYDLKIEVMRYLVETGRTVLAFGASSTERFDYPVASEQVAESILSKKSTFGVLVCGSGIGVCMGANRYPGIRAAQVLTPIMAELARQHNHANVICFGQRIQTKEQVLPLLELFLTTTEDNGERHVNRVNLLDGNISHEKSLH